MGKNSLFLGFFMHGHQATNTKSDYLRYLHTIAMSSLALELLYPPPPLSPQACSHWCLICMGAGEIGKDIVVFAGTNLIWS